MRGRKVALNAQPSSMLTIAEIEIITNGTSRRFSGRYKRADLVSRKAILNHWWKMPKATLKKQAAVQF